MRALRLDHSIRRTVGYAQVHNRRGGAPAAEPVRSAAAVIKEMGDNEANGVRKR